MTNWLEFKAIKRGVSLESLLRHYGVELRRSGPDQYRGRCPIHGGEGRDAFHVNLARNIFHCFACGAGGTVLDFVAAMEGCTLREAAEKLQARAIPLNEPATSFAPEGTGYGKKEATFTAGVRAEGHRQRPSLSGCPSY